LKPDELAQKVNDLTEAAVEEGHHRADLGDLLLGCALGQYKAAGFSPTDARALLVSRVRELSHGGGWKRVQ